jgi:hypothetical protein
MAISRTPWLDLIGLVVLWQGLRTLQCQG